jgi:hypothetical protein
VANSRRGGLGAAWRKDVVYRRVLQVLLLANVVAAVALVLLLTRTSDGPDPGPTASGGGAASAGGPVAAAPEAPETSIAPPPEGAQADPSFLSPPEEFLPVDDARARTGVLDLDAVAGLDAVDPPAARQRFEDLGFVEARSRAWQSATDALLVVAYEFADERGAATFVGEASALRLAHPAAVSLPLAGVPGASAFQLDVPGDPTQVAFLARGTTAYVVGLVGPAADDPTAATLHRLAALQYDAAL